MSEEKDQKFDASDHYFKVDSRILHLPKDALSKKELLVYLLHCRRMNPKKNQSCSFSGIKDASKCLNLNDEAFNIVTPSVKTIF